MYCSLVRIEKMFGPSVKKTTVNIRDEIIAEIRPTLKYFLISNLQETDRICRSGIVVE